FPPYRVRHTTAPRLLRLARSPSPPGVGGLKFLPILRPPRTGTSNPNHTRNHILASVPLIPKFACEPAARVCELRHRDSTLPFRCRPSGYTLTRHERTSNPLLDRLDRLDVATAAPESSLVGRRALFFALVAATMAGLPWLLAAALSAGGLDAFDLTLLALFAVTLPWSVIGFWNATIGFLIMRFASDPTAVVCPVAAPVRGTETITVSAAIVVCIRNESPERLIRNLKPLLTGLVAEGVEKNFHVYLLSDTDH